MCQLLPIEELENLKFAVASLAEMATEKGSYNRENARNAADGIRHRLNWVINQLKATGQGKNVAAALIALFLAVPAVAQQPLRCTVNWCDQEGQPWLDKDTGWDKGLITDAACEPSTLRPDVRACWAEFVAKAGPARYISYRLNDPGDPRYPSPILPVNPLTGKETITYTPPNGEMRIYPDIKRLDVRRKFIAAMVAELTRQPPSPILHDNITHPGAGGTTNGVYNWPFTWEQSCTYLRELKDALPPGYLMFANVAGYMYYWPQEEIDLLARSVAGVAFETPIHPNCRTNPTLMQSQIAAYRTLLKAGVVVVFMDINKSVEDKVRENFYTAAMAMMIREPGEGLYMHWNAGKFPDVEAEGIGHSVHWEHWPLLLGPPKGAIQIAADGSVSRDFAGGTLTAQAPYNAAVAWK